MRVHMRYGGRLPSSAGGRHGCGRASSAGGGVGGQRGLPTSSHAGLTLHPLVQRGHRVAGASIMGASLLKQGQYALGAGGSFQRQRVVYR